MASVFFVNYPFTVSQNTQIYAYAPIQNLALYDYIISFNFQGANSNVPFNKFFNVRTYEQGNFFNNGIIDPTQINYYAINLNVNHTLLNSLLLSNIAIINSNNTTIATTFSSVFATFYPNESSLPFRILEILATKIFASAKAQAAIANDTNFYKGDNVANSLLNQIINGIDITLQNQTVQNTIFNEYVALNRIIQPNTPADFNTLANFNFSNTEFDFPIFLSTNLYDIANDTALSAVNNGPNVGGTILTNGVINIPILLRFISNN